MNTNDLLSLTEAAKLLPSCRAGKRVHVATLYRWVLSGRLPAVKRGRYYFVRRADLDAMARPVERPCLEIPPRRPSVNANTQEEALRYLRAVGIL